MACPTIEAADWKHADRNIVNITDWTALGLVDFILVAHYGDKRKEAVEEGKKKTRLKVITLADNEFIKSDGGNFQKIIVN